MKMKSFVKGFLASLILAVAVLQGANSSYADGNHSNHAGFVEVDESNFSSFFTQGIKEDACLFLTEDITIISTAFVENDRKVTICLNGHTINFNGSAIQIMDNSEMIITDCTGKGILTNTVRDSGSMLSVSGNAVCSISDFTFNSAYVIDGVSAAGKSFTATNISFTSGEDATKAIGVGNGEAIIDSCTFSAGGNQQIVATGGNDSKEHGSVIVKNCMIESTTCAIRATYGGNITISDCTVYGSWNAIEVGTGGTVTFDKNVKLKSEGANLNLMDDLDCEKDFTLKMTEGVSEKYSYTVAAINYPYEFELPQNVYDSLYLCEGYLCDKYDSKTNIVTIMYAQILTQPTAEKPTMEVNFNVEQYRWIKLKGNAQPITPQSRKYDYGGKFNTEKECFESDGDKGINFSIWGGSTYGASIQLEVLECPKSNNPMVFSLVNVETLETVDSVEFTEPGVYELEITQYDNYDLICKSDNVSLKVTYIEYVLGDDVIGQTTNTFTDTESVGRYVCVAKNKSGATDYISQPVNYIGATVKFATNGSEAIPNQIFRKGRLCTEPAKPELNGYAFGGWFTDAECTKAFDFTTPVNGNIVLYAKWTPSYTISDEQLKANSYALRMDFKVVEEKGAMKVTWSKVKDADGYFVWAGKCGKSLDIIEPIRVKGAKKTSLTLKTIGSKKYDKKEDYKVYVVAYKTVGGEDFTIAKTVTAHVAGSKMKYTNAKAIMVKSSEVSVKKGKSVALNAKVTKTDTKKIFLGSKHAPKLRYEASNNKIKVDANGKVKGVKKGTAYVYIYAQNGMCKKVKVTVK